MKVFVAGATGAIGRQLVPQLIAAGHEVSALTRSADKQGAVRALGATPVVADALDPEQVGRAVAQAEPEVIVHELTAIPPLIDMRHFDRSFAQTNRLRIEGTDHLLAAARAVGARRFIAQSYAGWPLARIGEKVKDETAALDPHPAASMRETHSALRHLEDAVTGAEWIEGIVLRYGGLYGPGTGMDRGQPQVELIRKRRYPVIGSGAGMWSFVHVADAAAATVLAVDRGEPGIYHIVDDEPAPVSEWLPAAAAAIGAPAPRHLPAWLGRMLAGEAAVVMMTEISGAANAKAKRELGWQPHYRSWRDGFARELAGERGGKTLETARARA